MAYLPAPSTFTTLCADALPSELWAAVQGLLGKNGELAAQNGELTAENEKLKARVAELEEKAKRPAKTPANSSVPPSISSRWWNQGLSSGLPSSTADWM